jgi:hypothetical protein
MGELRFWQLPFVGLLHLDFPTISFITQNNLSKKIKLSNYNINILYNYC